MRFGYRLLCGCYVCIFSVTTYAQTTAVSSTNSYDSFETVISGIIYDAKTRAPIDAEFDLYFDNDIIKEDVQIVHEGKYLENLSKFGWYLIAISSPGYLDVNDTIWVINESRKSIHKDYFMTPIEVGLHVTIENIYFYFGSTDLKPESFSELDKIVTFFSQNPSIECEIGGHTDDEGADDYNMLLSEKRAQSVVNYLVGKGVNSSRLVAKGYGETGPIDNSGTKQGKARNRRVEFTILRK